MSLRGKLLVASPLLEEPTFRRAVVLLIEDNDDGAFGVILNRESTETVEDHLPHWAGVAAGAGRIHIGGPVEPVVGLALAPSRVGETATLPGLRLIDLEADPEEGLRSIRVYSGYSGWSPGQLDSELAEGAWYVVSASPDDPFESPVGQWSRVLRRQPGRLAIIASYPDDPGLN